MLDRLLIVSFDLVERVTGRSLDEAASEDEIKEAIFYDSSNGEKAVVLWGLCSALFDTFAGNSKQDVTVKLTNETLLMVPLEESGTVLAIAKLKRTSQHPQVSAATACRCIQRSHTLFCLLRKGGIEQRLDDQSSLRRLFELHKSARQNDSTAVAALDDYRSQLSLTQLRTELAVHYDTFLTEPMSNENEFHLTPPIQYLPKKTETGSTVVDLQQIQRLLTQARGLDHHIVAISVASSDDRSTLLHNCNHDNDIARLLTENDRASILLEHLLQVRESCLMAQQQQQQQGNYFVLVPTAVSAATAKRPTQVRTGFLAAPPLAQLSALDTCAEEIAIVVVTGEQDNGEDAAPVLAWAPRIHVVVGGGGDDDDHQLPPLRVVLYNTNIMLFVAEMCSSIDDPAVAACVEEASLLAESSSALTTTSDTTTTTTLATEDNKKVPAGSKQNVDCTLLPKDNAWIYRSSDGTTKKNTVCLDAGTYKTVGHVERAMMLLMTTS